MRERAGEGEKKGGKEGGKEGGRMGGGRMGGRMGGRGQRGSLVVGHHTATKYLDMVPSYVNNNFLRK
jgi:hypothetical protein